MNPKPTNIAIIGGSLGGLLTGVALKHLHKDLTIRIFERCPTPLLQDQGAGVVAGQDVERFFKKHDRTHTPLTVPSHQRLYLDKSGGIIDQQNQQQHMTSWDLLYHILRANFDGVETGYATVPNPEAGDGKNTYEYGYTVTHITTPQSQSQSQEKEKQDLDFSSPLTLHLHHHPTQTTTTTTADLIIAADGPSSTIRTAYFPSVQRTYAGYVAWRGTVPETQVSPPSTSTFVEKFPFYHKKGTQILAYTIPGHNGTTTPGKRLLNWVWYVNYASNTCEYQDVMTDKTGKKHAFTLPAGYIKNEIWDRQKAIAQDMLPPQFAELVTKTKIPFVQAITDVIAPRAVMQGGRVVLVGDALAGFRPHTAASTNQAALDAMEFAGAMGRIIDGGGEKGGGMEVLKKWEEGVMRYGKAVQQRGVQMGNRSQFGEHPMQR